MARKLAVAVMAQLHTGVNPANAVHSRRKGMTLGELFSRYKTHSLRGQKDDGGNRLDVGAIPGDLPEAKRKPHGAERTKAPGAVNWQRQKLSEITHQQVSKLRLDLGAKVGRTTANRVIELLSAMFNFAKQPANGFFIGENPAEGIGKFEPVERERYLRSDEAPNFSTLSMRKRTKTLLIMFGSQSIREHGAATSCECDGDCSIGCVHTLSDNNSMHSQDVAAPCSRID